MKKIEITFKDGGLRTWDSEDYTDYIFQKPNFFIIINGSQWVGIYNLDEIKEIIVK